MKILILGAGQVGSTAAFSLAREDAIILSHDGHGNPAMAADAKKVRIKPSIYYEGVNGRGAGLEFAYSYNFV